MDAAGWQTLIASDTCSRIMSGDNISTYTVDVSSWFFYKNV